MGIVPSMIPENSKEWSYFEWAPGYNTFIDPVGDGLYELVLQRGKTRDYHAIFHTFPTLLEYRTKDLFRQHPTRPNLWQYAGRLDDIIVFSNGEKFNPVTMEKRIEAMPLVSRALVVGQGRFQAALLIEPNWELWDMNGFTAVEAFIGAVWPQVQDANATVPTYARVMRDHIGIAARRKPFRTTAKGSTQRRQVNEEYKSEIELLYNRQNGTRPDDSEGGAFESAGFVRQAVISQLGRQIGDDDDLYVAGFDSLQTTSLANILSRAITRNDTDDRVKTVTAQMVYDNPSIASLSLVITGLLEGTNTQAEVSRAARINGLLESFTQNLPQPNKAAIPRPKSEGHVVMLTGSTGSFGSYILDTLLSDPSVKKIYCLNRSADAEARQTESQAEKGLRAVEQNRNHVEFVQAEFSDDQLGLTQWMYRKLLEEVNVVIHNAWKVDFNQSLASFHLMIKGVRSLIDFASQTRYCAHLFFVSSISSIGAWNPSMGQISAPEGPVHSPDAALKQGYAESKHVAERLCYAASDKVGIPITVLRVGQIAGPTTRLGRWNPREWVPALVQSSISLGQIPSTMGSANEINWIPIVRHLP
jgi:NAD(P)-dependent dehydrogenase (short-subunit alcohol dehydrogenase family)